MRSKLFDLVEYSIGALVAGVLFFIAARLAADYLEAAAQNLEDVSKSLEHP